MPKHRLLAAAGPLPSDFANTIQEFIGTMVSANFAVSIFNTTTLQVVAGANNDQRCVAIDGRWRWINATVQAAAPGGLIVGDNPVFVTASDNAFVPSGVPGVPETDNTDYEFFLMVMTAGATPSGAGTQTLWRQVAWATWDGVQFTDVRMLVGSGSTEPAKHEATHLAGGSDALPWTTIHEKGTLLLRPTAALTNAGYTYFATDVNGGTLYRSTGAAWDQTSIGLTAAILASIGTAKGDIIAFSASGVPVRVAVGLDGTAVTADSTAAAGVSYKAAGGTNRARLVGFGFR